MAELVAGPDGARYAASTKGLFRLPAGAGEWEQVSKRSDLVNLFVTPAGTLLSGAQRIDGAGVPGAPLLRSSVDGKQWQPTSYRDRPTSSVAAEPACSCRSLLYATEDTVLLSDDEGKRWFGPPQLGSDSAPGDLAVAPDDCTLYLGLNPDRPKMSVRRAFLRGGVYGRPTEVLATRGPAAVTAGSGGRVAVGAMNGFWWSSDEGNTWRLEIAGLADVLARPGDPRWEVNVDSPAFPALKMTEGGVVFAATWSGLYRFQDERWRRISDRVPVDRLALIDGFVFYRAGGAFRCAGSIAGFSAP